MCGSGNAAEAFPVAVVVPVPSWALDAPDATVGGVTAVVLGAWAAMLTAASAPDAAVWIASGWSVPAARVPAASEVAVVPTAYEPLSLPGRRPELCCRSETQCGHPPGVPDAPAWGCRQDGHLVWEALVAWAWGPRVWEAPPWAAQPGGPPVAVVSSLQEPWTGPRVRESQQVRAARIRIRAGNVTATQ